MNQLRRKVENYTVLCVIREGSMPDVTLHAIGALRVREGKEAGRFCCTDFQERDTPKRKEILEELREFIGNDLVITTNISELTPLMDQIYLDYIDTFFTNATLDLLPYEEEAVRHIEDPEAYENEISTSRKKTDPIERVQDIHRVYEKTATLLYKYQEGFPYWICSLPYDAERRLFRVLPKRKRKLWLATLLWLVGLHYFYLGQPKRNLFYLLTLGGCFLWMLTDLYRLPLMVDQRNEEIAEEAVKGGEEALSV